jgi:hypothetical protein
MSLGLRISIVITAILAAASTFGYLWLRSMAAAGDGGHLIVFYFWILLTILATVPSALITLGIWLGKRNRKAPSDNSFGL